MALRPWLPGALATALGSALAALPGAAQAAGGDLVGDPVRGAAIVASRSQGLCVLCHAVPGQPEAAQGNLGPPLHGVGARLTADQLRLRLEQPERFNPDTVMPSYSRSQGLRQVAAARDGQPLFSAQQLADVLAYLVRLQ
ncbi:sulfur oxidation c-type cytochrome SoxX [Aquabacterium sp. OR-4]|uniref:sulfur oxidation c-type cytochrome SoxX n=1 Tax=Aquabacterium sp. OR-4 TaxID=2978127 RepID=UPI0021B3E7FC|nr:sulfur oxidation c-type cytochrome SoxX [Aquabacterium sp. OR-4]MDT7835886.1 sulfur oxidation c-type cytochrome SoxX [Aquabacterium sp. OR-4]